MAKYSGTNKSGVNMEFFDSPADSIFRFKLCKFYRKALIAR